MIAIARDDDARDGSCVMSQAKNNLGRLDLPSRYTHTPADFHRLIQGTFAPAADDSLTKDDNHRSKEPRADGEDAP
ncbi:hypothetical protein [Micromonospora deserti]|uniref:hypothetical protein n=1 Tax=Micromonospora deserti TaxID=2070366 RepID=UPI0018F4B077|nr:hypothetical protein [Micromonospora deserti]